MLSRPIASIPSTAITSALLILATNPIALAAENLPRSSFPVPSALSSDFALPSSLLLAQTDPRKAEADRLLEQGIQQAQTSQFREACNLGNKQGFSIKRSAIVLVKPQASEIWAMRTEVWDSTRERSTSINKHSPSTERSFL